ncbi:MAG: hypothetical protein WC225_04820 [Acholeplasmataceae bacterium]|nr:hypothetical protein [Acholeplasmataceae bacterium]
MASTDRTVQLWDMKAQALETFGFSFLMPHLSGFDSFYMPTGPYSANEFIHQAFLEILLDMAALPSAEQPFTIYEKEGDYKLVLALNHVNNQEYQEIFKAFDFLDMYFMNGTYDFTIEMIFVNNQIDRLTVSFENFFQTIEQTLVYTNETIEAPTDLGSYVKNFTTSAITLHIGDEVITTILDHYNIADFVGVGAFGEEVHELVMHLFTPYVEGKVVEGYYLDEQLTIKAEITDFLNDIDLYFKWKNPASLETIIENFYFSDGGKTYLSILGVVEQSLYFEGEEGIVFSQGEDYYYFDVASYQLFEITLEPTVVATVSHETWDYSSLDTLLQGFENNISITPKHNYAHKKWADIVIFNETGLLMGTVGYGVLPDIYIKNPNGLDFIATYDAIVTASLNPEIDEMAYYQLLTWDYFQDIRTLEDDMFFLVHFMSGSSSYMTLKKMKDNGLIDYILPSEDNSYTFTLIENGISSIFNEYKFYDSQKGKIVAVKGSGDYEYLNDMVALPEIINDHDFLDAVGFYVNDLYDVDTLQELKDLSVFDKVLILSNRYDLKPYATLLSDLDTKGNIIIHGYYYDIYYKINADYFLLHLSGVYDDVILSVTDTEFKMYNANQYIEVGLENIDLFAFNSRVIWPMFGYNFSQDELDAFIRLLDVFSNQVPHEVIDGKYEFDNDSTVYFEVGRMFIDSGPYVFEITSTEELVSNIYDTTNYNNIITIKSDHKPDIVLKSVDFDGIIYPNGTINYTDYILVEFYEIIEDVHEDDPYDVFSYAGGVLNLYADFAKAVSVEELGEKFLTNDKYILRGLDSEIKVVKDEAVYIYIEEELVYYLDTVNEAAYEFIGDTLYRLFEYEAIFNYDTFFQNLKAEDFISNGVDRYYYSGIYPYLMWMDLYFDNETIELNVGPASYNSSYTFVDEDFIAPGINVGTAVDEEIVKTFIHPWVDFVDMKHSAEAWLLSFELTSNTGQTYYYDYNEFNLKYEAYFNMDGFNSTLVYDIGDGLVTVLLTDLGIYIYNTDVDAVLISTDTGQAFNLYEIDALPVGEFGFSFITGWTVYGEPVDLEALRDERESNEIFILPVIEYMTVLEAVDQIQEKLYLKVNFFSQAMSSWGTYYYDYEDDVAYFEAWSSPYPWTVTFDDDQITITERDYSFITTVDTYNLDIDPYDPGLPFNYFNEVIQSMVELRAFINEDFVIESSNPFGYTFFEDGNRFAAFGEYAFYIHDGLYSTELWILDTKPQG